MAGKISGLNDKASENGKMTTRQLSAKAGSTVNHSVRYSQNSHIVICRYELCRWAPLEKYRRSSEDTVTDLHHTD
ncbi:hypothetical protein ACQPT2_18355 [Erwinia amylovora]